MSGDNRRQRKHGLAGLLLAGLLLSTGCRTTSEDLQRWATREQGPGKLAAVVSHAKYPLGLRVEAALTLIGMKPRGGQRVGIERALAAVIALPEQERAQLVAGMVPILVSEINKAPAAPPDQNDSTIPYKDAAYELLLHPHSRLAPGARAQLEGALQTWTLTAFARRWDNSSQKYGVAQVVRLLGTKGAAKLPNLLLPGAAKVPQISDLIAELGSSETKLAASERLVALARSIDPEQQEDLLRVLAAMKKIGQHPVIEYLLQRAADPSAPEHARAASLAALEGHMEQRRGPQTTLLLDVAQAPTTPDSLRELALRRIAELPRSEVVRDLYDLFQGHSWKLRWLAAERVLALSDVSHLPEFMAELKDLPHMNVSEPLRYGALLGQLAGGDAKAVVPSYLASRHATPVRLVALGYYAAHGGRGDVALVTKYNSVRAAVPRCPEHSADCAWQCTVGGDEDPRAEPIATIGDFVRFCVLPAMTGRIDAMQGGPPPPAQ